MLSVPAEFRYQKRLSDTLLNRYYRSVSREEVPDISSRFQWGGDFADPKDFLRYRLIVRLNVLMQAISRGRLSVFNEYATEDHGRLLRRDFSNDLRGAVQDIEKAGIIDHAWAQTLATLSLRSKIHNQQFQAMNVSRVLQMFRGNSSVEAHLANEAR